jgi:hypothetical protein
MVVVSDPTVRFSNLLLKCSVLLYSSIRFFIGGKISDGGGYSGYAEALSYFQMTGGESVSAANFA